MFYRAFNISSGVEGCFTSHCAVLVSTKAEGSTIDIHSFLSIFLFYTLAYVYTCLPPFMLFVNRGRVIQPLGLSGCHKLNFHLLFRVMIERGEK